MKTAACGCLCTIPSPPTKQRNKLKHCLATTLLTPSVPFSKSRRTCSTSLPPACSLLSGEKDSSPIWAELCCSAQISLVSPDSSKKISSLNPYVMPLNYPLSYARVLSWCPQVARGWSFHISLYLTSPEDLCRCNCASPGGEYIFWPSGF